MNDVQPSSSHRTGNLGFFCLAMLVSSLLSTPGNAAIVVSPPDEQVRLLEEHALIVFDPLTASQTLVVHHVFAPTSVSFGLILPVPATTQTIFLRERTRKLLQQRLHPEAQPRRVVDVEFESWLRGCIAREVGLPDMRTVTENREGTLSGNTVRNIGAGVEAMHAWLIGNGFTLAPEQTRWLDHLRAEGWSFVALRLDARDDDRRRDRLTGPVIALTHAAESPIMAAGRPGGRMIPTKGKPSGDLEIAVLTEWSCIADTAPKLTPFYSMPFSERQLKRLTRRSRTAPWSFRRSGVMTAFSNPSLDSHGIIKFERTDPRPKIYPPVRVVQRPSSVVLPVELVVICPGFLFWLWVRKRRSERLFGRVGERLR